MIGYDVTSGLLRLLDYAVHFNGNNVSLAFPTSFDAISFRFYLFKRHSATYRPFTPVFVFERCK